MSDDTDWTPMEDGTFPSTLGRLVERRRDGLVELGLYTDDHHKNRSGIVHGGVVMTLLDRAIGMNARNAGNGRRMATATLTVNFLRPAKVGHFLHATCKLTKNGRKAAFGDAVLSADGEVVATATGIFMTVDAPGKSA